MLLPRFLTSLVGVPLLLVSIWWGQLPFLFLMCGVVLLSLYEFYTLAEEASWPVSKRLGLGCGFFFFVFIVLFGTRMGWDKTFKSDMFFSPAAISLMLFVLALNHLFTRNREYAFINLAVTWLGLFYVVWTLSHIVLIRDLRPRGMAYTFFLFIVTWVLDIAAYMGGKRFGKTKLSEHVSPKKTWEGAVIGSFFAFLAATLCHFIFLKELPLFQNLLLGALVIVVAQLSDFSESLFKRNVQVKDSGSLLPGHGGILDRFDSFLLSAPVYYYAVVFFVR